MCPEVSSKHKLDNVRALATHTSVDFFSDRFLWSCVASCEFSV